VQVLCAGAVWLCVVPVQGGGLWVCGVCCCGCLWTALVKPKPVTESLACTAESRECTPDMP